jgi:sterol desaturase/sphingolipid hydroxylase (fatty acid hydroxylase superfamily)
MESSINALAGRLLEPLLSPLDPSRRIYWLYLASALLIAAAVSLWGRGTSDMASRKNVIAYLFPRDLYRHRSTRLDCLFFYVNAVLGGMILAPLVGAPAVAGLVADAVGGRNLTPEPAGLWAYMALTLATVTAMDLALYIGHYLQHRVPLLWEFHKVHHSAEILTPMTAFRVHPVDDALTLTLTASFAGAAQGAFHVWFGTGIAEIEVLGVNAVLFAWYVLGFNLRHSHVWLAYPVWLSHVLVSPAQHQIHHSREPRHFDKNLGFIFAFWDAAVGTLYVPRSRESFAFGLAGGEHAHYRSATALYVRPFRNLWATQSRWPASDPAPKPAVPVAQ